MKNAGLILYVDDERPNRIVFEQCFRERFHVRTVGSAGEALAIVQNEPVAVLVTDQRMPDMPGHELLHRVKVSHPEVVRMVITAYSDLDPILRAVNEGLVARYLIKPWDRRELEQLLAWSLEAYHLGRESSALQLRLMQTERLVTLGSIGAAVAHDLKHPLSHLRTNAERLQQLAAAAPRLRQLTATGTEASLLVDLAEELPELAQAMVEGCDLMLDVLRGMNALIHPEAASLPRATDPIPVLRYALSVCRATGVRLHLEIPEAPAQVHMGATELTQVLINLVSNAVQAIEAHRPSGQVTVRLEADLEEVRIVVTDDGPGMSPEVQRKLGTPFFSTRREGTGLGIAQCRRLVGAVGGTLQIDSAPGQGTRVTITLKRG